jgi:hypothetical protein
MHTNKLIITKAGKAVVIPTHEEYEQKQTMKNVVFLDVSPCEFIINQRFGGACRLHLQGRRNNLSEEKC